jgi:hypothetical protein
MKFGTGKDELDKEPSFRVELTMATQHAASECQNKPVRRRPSAEKIF